RMRSLAPWFIITVGGLFVLFMVLSDSRITDIITQRSNNIGSVNGEDITYQEFTNVLEQYRQFQVNQTGQEIPENQMEMLRENAWQLLVNQRLLRMKIDELGLTVTDEEVREALLGPNPPASVTQYFVDSTGSFNREAYEAAIYNPQNKQAMIQVEEQVRDELLQKKLQDQINASIVISDDQIMQRYVEQNIKMDVKYVLVNTNTIEDSAAQVSEDDIEDFYEENKDNYKIDPQRKVKYVLFRKKASEGDSTAIRNNLNDIVTKLSTDTSSFKTYVEIYSDQPYKKDSVSVSQIPAEAQDAIVNASAGDILGPLMTSEGYAVYRMVDKFRTDDITVKASHILVSIDPQNPNNDSLAMAVYNRVTKGGEDFGEVAREISQDPGSGSKGGDLGWFGKGMMVPEFEKAAFGGRIGVVQRPVKSQFGWHIIKTTGRISEKFVVEKIVNKIEPSHTTLDRLYENANDFSYLADSEGFEKIASELGYDVIETTGFKEDARTIPGLGTNKALTVFAFENGIGSVSPVFNVPSGYAVVMVSEIIKGGYKPLEEVKDAVTNLVKTEKKKEKSLSIARQIYDRIKQTNTMKSAHEVYNKAVLDSVTSITFTGTIPKIGKDYAFVQKAYEAPMNEFTEPFMGSRGSFIINVTNKTAFDSTAYSIQKSSIRNTIQNQKKSTMFTNWLNQIKQEASIVDNRHMFYR
ncbi:MAG: peptidylprolyl isomerase, partial [Melioribacteraceae bacterium]|nr:peptidylprolyl isomerase [Melioribacteraceae bacterium]